MQAFLESLQTWSFLGIPATRWLLAVLVLFATLVIQKLFVVGLNRIVRHLSARTTTQLDHVLLNSSEKPAAWLILIIGIIATLHTLKPPAETWPIIALVDQIGRVATIVIGTWFLWRLLEAISGYLVERAKKTESPLDDQLVPFVTKTLKIFMVITAVLVAAQNMGYSISGLIASLGIGGIAVAMAARDTIANVFGSIMLLVDRPFTVGDWIKTSEFEGVVEEVGFRSTRIRTFAKTLVNVPNATLANMVIDNIDARSMRRIKMRIGITYSTTPAQMQKAIEGIEDILKKHPGVDQNFSLVKFDEFEDSSLSIFLYYFSKSTNWVEYLQVRQEVNMQMMQLLEKLGLEFAFPSRSIYLHQEQESPAS